MALKRGFTQKNNKYNFIIYTFTNIFTQTFSRFIAEVHQVGFGETARFIIESNDLFKVNAKAEGVRKGVDQPIFDDEITLNARPCTIDAAIDWYPMISKVFDMGSFGIRIAKSFSAYIFLKAIKGMTVATAEFGAAYSTNGVTPQLWGTLRERVSAANGGANVIAVGTAVALSSVSLQGNFQVEIGEEMNKVGYLDQYLGVPLVAVNNVLVPGTTNTTATLALDDKKIYMIPVAGMRPVKILFEPSINVKEENNFSSLEKSTPFIFRCFKLSPSKNK